VLDTYASVHFTGTSTEPLELTCRMVITKVDLGSLEKSGEPFIEFKLKVPRVVPLAVMVLEACGA